MRVILRLMSCLLALTSLRKLKGANAGNRTRPNAHVIPPADKDCVGYDLDGKIYNLAALERKDAKPRYYFRHCMLIRIENPICKVGPTAIHKD